MKMPRDPSRTYAKLLSSGHGLPGAWCDFVEDCTPEMFIESLSPMVVQKMEGWAKDSKDGDCDDGYPSHRVRPPPVKDVLAYLDECVRTHKFRKAPPPPEAGCMSVGVFWALAERCWHDMARTAISLAHLAILIEPRRPLLLAGRVIGQWAARQAFTTTRPLLRRRGMRRFLC